MLITIEEVLNSLYLCEFTPKILCIRSDLYSTFIC